MNNISIKKYEDSLKELNNKLQALKTFSVYADKEEIRIIEQMILEARKIISKANCYNQITSKNKVSEKDISSLKNISSKLN